MIQASSNCFHLATKETSYCFRVLETGHLEHLYYGKKIHPNYDALTEKHPFGVGNAIYVDNDHMDLCLENLRTEVATYGKGDIHEPFLVLRYPDGSRSSDFRFEGSEVVQGKEALATLPASYGSEEQATSLHVWLKDKNSDCRLHLYYGVFEDTNVITRSAKLENLGEETIVIERMLSTQVDFPANDYVFTSFHGAWAREMRKTEVNMTGGKFVNASFTGSSSSRSNPFVMLSEKTASEDYGKVYGFNLVYSGNHYEAVEVTSFGKTRFVAGINPEHFAFLLKAGETFESPEAVMTFSDAGFNGMSQNMHHFVQNHIVRGEWAHKERPVLLNSWEAAYFDINEKKLLKLAKAAADTGMELFVMDDGWFGDRNTDTKSLGDWYVNKNKLPNGIEGLAKKINDLGLLFGIWVEPEMINVDSDLYRAHPDWAVDIPGKEHAEGRFQRILDLVNPDVQDYIIDAMSKVFETPGVAYVKWDMNRIFSDVYSKILPPEQQGEVFHRYMMALYHIMKTLTEKFPHILFEGCAAGGNRFDLGILSYFPQIWASDDTDALYRVNAMTNYSYGYPMSTVSAHVSACPNHQTLRTTPLETRFHVSAFGVAGYECNLCDMSKEDQMEIANQVSIYKTWRKTMQYGDFYRGRNGNIHEWTVVSPDQEQAVGFLMQELVQPHTPFLQYFAKGLAPEYAYHFFNRDLKHSIKAFGDLINTQSPIHIKQDSLIQDLVAKFVKLNGETEDAVCNGDLLMEAGIKLSMGFAGTGYNDDVRYLPDFGSRIYFMEKVEEMDAEETNTEETNTEEV